MYQYLWYVYILGEYLSYLDNGHIHLPLTPVFLILWQKDSWNQINKFLFSWNCIFSSSKIDFLAIFEVAKNGIWSKKLFIKLIYLTTRVFWPGLSKMFWPTVKCDLCGYNNMTMSEKRYHDMTTNTIIWRCWGKKFKRSWFGRDPDSIFGN